MPRRRKNDEDRNFDLLIDTLTDVMGFLVMLLMLMHLGVSDAVRRLLMAGEQVVEIAPDELVKAKEQSADLKKLLDAVRQRWTDISGSLALDRTQAIDMARIAGELRKELEEKPPATVDLAQLQKQIDDRRKRSEELDKQVTTALTEVARLRALLDQTPAPQLPPANVVRLPNPRPAPPGAQPVLFLCRGDRVWHVDAETLQERAETAVRAFIRQQYPGRRDFSLPIDCKKLVDYFEKANVGDTQFRLHAKFENNGITLLLERRPNTGEPADRIKAPSSIFQRALKRADRRKTFARFVVWPDGFGVYQTARHLCDEAEIAGGWDPTATPEEWKVRLAGVFKCIEEPVKPAPPPPPPPVNPQPAPPPPPRPPLPKDEID